MQWGGNLYKSTDKGRTFTLTDFPNQSYPHMNNGDTRTQGAFGAVDPKCSNVVYFGTPARGMYRSTNGVNFTQMTTFAGGLPASVQRKPPRSSGTDTSSVTVGLGDKLFNLNSAAFPFNVGDYVKIWRTTDRTVQMFGTVKTISGTTFTLTVDTAFGSGTFSNWTVGIKFLQESGNSGVCGGHRVLFVPDGQTVTAFGQTVSKNLYIHTHGVNTWKSTDGGVTWTPVLVTQGTFFDSDGPPNFAIRQWAADPFGVIWVVGDNYPTWDNIYKYDDTVPAAAWTQLPAMGGVPAYDTVVIDPFNSPSKGATTAIFLVDSKFIVYFTTDGGATWQGYGDISHRTMSTPANDVLWFQEQFTRDQTTAIAVCCAKFDPLSAGKIWVSGEGCYYFTYSRALVAPIALTQQTRGVEEFIPAQVLAPATNNYWLTVWDFPLFQKPPIPAVFPSKDTRARWVERRQC